MPDTTLTNLRQAVLAWRRWREKHIRLTYAAEQARMESGKRRHRMAALLSKATPEQRQEVADILLRPFADPEKPRMKPGPKKRLAQDSIPAH